MLTRPSPLFFKDFSKEKLCLLLCFLGNEFCVYDPKLVMTAEPLIVLFGHALIRKYGVEEENRDGSFSP
jgi:hypothetical protein